VYSIITTGIFYRIFKAKRVIGVGFGFGEAKTLIISEPKIA
jgi:hypothetical protein